MQGGGDGKPAAKTAGIGLQASVNARPFIPGGVVAGAAAGKSGGAPSQQQPDAPGGPPPKPQPQAPIKTGWGPKGGAAAQATGAGSGTSSPMSKSPSVGSSSQPSGKAGSVQQGGGGSGGGGAGVGVGAKMSAGATSFVPKAASSPVLGAAVAPTSDPVPKSPQQQLQHHGSNKGLGPPLRSPGKGGRGGAGGPPAASFPSPGGGGGRGGGGGGGGRGGGGRGPGRGGGRGALLGSFAAGGVGLVPGLDLDAPGPRGSGSGSGGGAKRPLLLAQHQGNYAGAHGHYSVGQGRSLLAAQFMSEALRQQLQQHNYLIQSQWMPSGDEPALPDMIGHYHTLYPLEDLAAAEEHPSSSLGVRTCVVKGINPHDGRAYALRRVDGKQVLPSGELLSNARQAVELWSQLSGHPGLVCPREVFVTADLDGSPSLVVAHPYHPGAITVAQAHLLPTQTASGQLVRNSPNEAVLWSYTIQLAAALRAVHASGLSVRPACLSPGKVLVLPLGRLRVGCLGLAEALAGDVNLSQEELLQAQRDDVMAMGQLLLTLACSAGGVSVPNLDFAAAHFSPDFVRCLALLLGAGEGGAFSWRHVAALTGERMMMEVDTLAIFNDNLVSDLSKEMENGRLFRLMVKLGFVNERPEGDLMSHWSETGDRYLLKLFRDFVFHQTEADGAPRIDWGHVIECLNKLDAGVQEQVLLLSRDEQSMLVASYSDIKRCIESAFAELRSASARTAGR